MLARREHSESELRRKLAKAPRGRRSNGRRMQRPCEIKASLWSKSPTQEDDEACALDERGEPMLGIARVITRLREDNLLSDQRFAEGLVRNRIGRGQGPMKIRMALRERGIDDALVDEFLTFDDEFWLEQARAADERRFGKAEDGVVPAEWDKRARFLAGRGFPSDIIYKRLGARAG